MRTKKAKVVRDAVMNMQIIARKSVSINAPAAKVWGALVNPEMIKQYMFGTTVVCAWKVGSPILFKGEWKGKAYEDKGVILRFEPDRILQYSYFSPLSGVPDLPENYHIVTMELSKDGKSTILKVSQDNNQNEKFRAQSEKNWGVMLQGLKKLLEK
jgi:uncharacterized protein YndB with AHSA1/START domain